uniref:NAD(P)-binding domain-containing protein n=1 Tax=Aureoumbra lagunensis TaxID=44058 RepID=A0A7S3K6N9_9STRA|mmetsp:Transcript_17950/g.26989  ORF Transcript_17950/g.26989 Transcript_17950/m.26989 type:complete len:234 (+) Transcript_17950:35-736(+)
MMASENILVLGATGPSGIVLLRELLHRKLPVLAYCRTPSKIPEDISSDPLLEVVKGEMSQRDALSNAISKSRAIISLLGPTSAKLLSKTEFADYYRMIVPLMKEHGVSRILALGTISIYQPDDQSSISRALLRILVMGVANTAYHNILAIQEYFETLNDISIDWIVFRVGLLSGSSDQSTWLANRGEAFAGPVGAPGHASSMNRSVLAHWLADVATADPAVWVRQMPAISKAG